MEVQEFDEYLFVPNTPDFDVKNTLECGQTFRFKVRDFGYTVYSLNHKADIYCQKGGTKIFTKDKKYFIKYFDFCTNYARIKSSLSVYPELKPAIKYGNGIRILNQSALEMIIEFIISQNNNIPRIKGIIEKLCSSYGEKIDDYYAFPTLEKLKTIPLEFFKSIGCGYRDRYLYETIKALDYDLIEKIDKLDTEQARLELMKLKGVGRKVADCILLFGYRKTDVFPTDTWIIKVYNKLNNTDIRDAKKISSMFTQKYGLLSGYAQQYLFYQMRENS